MVATPRSGRARRVARLALVLSAACSWLLRRGRPPSSSRSLLATTGNPVLWAVGSIAAGTLWGWPYVGAFLKPTVAPLGFLGARGRRWWVAVAVSVLLSLPFAFLWADYARVLLHAHNEFGIDYLVGEFPLVLLPVVAWAVRRDQVAPMSNSLSKSTDRRSPERTRPAGS
jgi:hypothetical protein